MANFWGVFLLFSGHIIGLGAVTVIDLHGFLAQKSAYWTEATIRTHKITKPLIWIGITLALLGGLIFYLDKPFELARIHGFIALLLVLNGQFLTFKISPHLLLLEKQNKQNEILPKKIQNQIKISFVISLIGWWSSVIFTSLIISGKI